MNELKVENSNWEHYTLYMIFKNPKQQNSERVAKISTSKEEKQLSKEDERDQVTYFLKKIRAYVYLKTIWNWMDEIIE